MSEIMSRRRVAVFLSYVKAGTSVKSHVLKLEFPAWNNDLHKIHTSQSRPISKRKNREICNIRSFDFLDCESKCDLTDVKA